MSRAQRMLKSESARKRRRITKEIRDGVQERLFSKLRKLRRKKNG